MADKVVISVRSTGQGAAFGKKATLDGMLESAWPVICPDVALTAGTGIVDALAGSYGADVSGLRMRCLNAYGAVICTGRIVTAAVPADADDFVLAELLDPVYAPTIETLLPCFPAGSGWCVLATPGGDIVLRNGSGAAVPAQTLLLSGAWMIE